MVAVNYTVIHSVRGRVRLRIANLNKNVEARLAKRLSKIIGVETYRFNHAASCLVIRYTPHLPLTSLLDLLFAQGPPQQYNTDKRKIQGVPREEKRKRRIPKNSLSLPLIAIALACLTTRYPPPVFRWLARGVLIMAALPVAQRAVKGIIKGKLNIDCLDLLAIGFSSLQGKILTPALVITLHQLGDLIREYTARATAQKTASLLDSIGKEAWVEREGRIVKISSEKVAVGEIVIVYPGERIPVDGFVISGEASVNQSQLTGESMPIIVQRGSYVYASTLVQWGKLKIRAERVANQTRAAATIQLLLHAPVHDTRMANYAAIVAEKLLLPSLLLAILVLIITKDATRAASILTLDFITGIRVSIPTAFLVALNHTTRHGALVKSGRALELLSQIDTIIFDKTGTLTEGKVKIVGVSPVSDKITSKRLLQLAASAEQRINHPLAKAIVEYSQQEGVEILPTEEWSYQVGGGIVATIDGVEVLVGSERFLRTRGVAIETPPTNGAVCIAAGGELLGYIEYNDPLRKDTIPPLPSLEQYNIQVHLLTGDNQNRALEVANIVGIPTERVYAEAFPEDKAKIVCHLHQEGKVVAFVGDGLNDAAALAYADVSVSFASASHIALDTADVVLMDDKLLALRDAIAIAKETRSLIEQNIVLVVVPNFIALVFACTVGINPLIATLIHNGTAILAGLNSLRPLLPHLQERI